MNPMRMRPRNFSAAPALDRRGFLKMTAAAGAGLTLGFWTGATVAQESGPGKTSRQLLHVARLLRDEARFRELLGDVDYRASVADRLWGVYQMIGKLSPRVYVLKPRA